MDVQEAASVDLKGLDEILASIPDAGPNDLIPILQKIQTAYGYLPPDAAGARPATSRAAGI
ncbi:MAG: hypothetical protein ACYSUP_17010 [Planctomycetota bacterium]|jgi:NADH:ubiquinone oxidoreductase subunit E